ncbi:MAG: hypothetical protein KC561_04500 [Myxococcales bacterium]|nr:hypothetical protein [Myxococcales bacterium]
MRPILRIALLLSSATLAACTYNPPPEPLLNYPEAGVFEVGDTLELTFSEAVNPETLAIRVWTTERGTEGELLPDQQPVLALCRPQQEMCDTTQFVLADDNASATITFDSADIGSPGLPHVLEIVEGLEDPEGNKTGVPYWFSFQFVPEGSTNTDPVEFEEGVYLISSDFTITGIRVTLKFIADMQSLEFGQIAFAGAIGTRKDPSSSERETRDPAEIIVDADDGATLYSTGQVSESDGLRTINILPVDLAMEYFGIDIDIVGLQIQGVVNLSEETGHDRMEGTMNVAEVRVNGRPVDLESQPIFIGDWVPPELIPDGTPQVCGDLCGITENCDPPSDFPPSEFCAD